MPYHVILAVTLQSRLISQLSKQTQNGAKVGQRGKSRPELFLFVLSDSRARIFPLHHAVPGNDLVQSDVYAVLYGQ